MLSGAGVAREGSGAGEVRRAAMDSMGDAGARDAAREDAGGGDGERALGAGERESRGGGDAVVAAVAAGMADGCAGEERRRREGGEAESGRE